VSKALKIKDSCLTDESIQSVKFRINLGDHDDVAAGREIFDR